MYIGNGAYCYANSASMLIRGFGEEAEPSLLEVLSGVGLGITLYKNGHLFLHNNTCDPDTGISHAMRALGYSFTEAYSQEGEGCPLQSVRKVLEDGTAMLGPVDMGYLTYAPNHMYAKGSDHYILAYAMDDEFIYLHDPACFPHVRLPLGRLVQAWRAEDLPYGRGPYQYWHSIKRESSPSREEMYVDSLVYFRHLYENTDEMGVQIGAKTGRKAIEALIENVERKEVSQEVINDLKYFVFQLGAKRAGDYAVYFKEKHPVLSQAKREQSRVLGLCHSLIVEGNWQELTVNLREFAELEDEFKASLLGLADIEMS
ncbi:hypothetical protein V1498_21725 [Peribacillus sp. SCS-26]|uniref:hypothetical protein n=1 Tax=Paraperibacillus marinus TaxID=3115295 RepID=UPI0039064C17